MILSLHHSSAEMGSVLTTATHEPQISLAQHDLLLLLPTSLGVEGRLRPPSEWDDLTIARVLEMSLA